MQLEYKVRDPMGRILDGTLAALSADDAREKLARDGFHVIQVRASGDDAVPDLLPKRIRRKDIIYVANQLAIMVETGVTLAAALSGVAEQEENPTLKKLLLELRQRVEGGEDFSTALANHPKYFDKTFVAMIRASEQTGSLGAMLERIANYLQKEQETRAKVRGAMAYPLAMLLIAIGVTVFLLTFVLPKFQPLFNREGFELPTPTVVLLAVSGVFTNYWIAWVVGLLTVTVSFLIVRRTERGRSTIDWIKLRLPVLGSMNRKVALSRSIRTLGSMVQAGVSVLDAIQLSAEVCGNVHYARSWQRVLDRITQGDKICDCLRTDPLFPNTLVQMISAGEETGRLDHVLGKVSDHYDAEVDAALKTTTSLIEPIMITIMGLVVGGIGMGLMLPIFKLSSHAG